VHTVNNSCPICARLSDSYCAQAAAEQLTTDVPEMTVWVRLVAWFLPDERVRYALRTLYEWAAPGSRLFLCDTNRSIVTPATIKMEELYKKVREPVYPRNEPTIRALFGEWTLCEPGLRPLEEWIPVERTRVEKATEMSGGNLVGAILAKER